MKKIICPDCKTKMEEKEIVIDFKTNPHGYILREAHALVCPKCGMELIPENECDRVLKEIEKIKEENPVTKEARVIFL
jgi:YgiT-type zinc finger domain-containing protein